MTTADFKEDYIEFRNKIVIEMLAVGFVSRFNWRGDAFMKGELDHVCVRRPEIANRMPVGLVPLEGFWGTREDFRIFTRSFKCFGCESTVVI
jgi:hypothetical protein